MSNAHRFGHVNRHLRNILDLAATVGGPVVTPDRYEGDPSSGKVARYLDWNSNKAFVQSTSAQQTLPPVRSARYGGRFAATHSSMYYDWNGPAADFRKWNDGTARGYLCVCECTSGAADRYLFGSFGVGGERGIGFAFGAGIGYVAIVQGGAGSAVTALSGMSTASVTVQCSFEYTEGASPEYTIDASTAAPVTGNSASAPDAADPQLVLRLGARPTGVVPWIGTWGLIAFLPAGNMGYAMREAQAYFGIAP